MKRAGKTVSTAALTAALTLAGPAAAFAQYGSPPDSYYCNSSTGCAEDANGNRIDPGPLPHMTDAQRRAQLQCFLQFGAGGFGIAAKGLAAAGGVLTGGSALLGPCATYAGSGVGG